MGEPAHNGYSWVSFDHFSSFPANATGQIEIPIKRGGLEWQYDCGFNREKISFKGN